LYELPLEQRETIILHHFEGLPFDQIAPRLRKTSGSVQKLWIRGLGKLRHIMGDP
jgi:DNA-directed RNA polymerase specialized sigma24 family protein